MNVLICFKTCITHSYLKFY